ncbi:MAG TPA: oxygenase MpaB family protein [Dongiaceae bacterium]|nr:oxygenase MpaB family protein [Dongiaceae bacterium]
MDGDLISSDNIPAQPVRVDVHAPDSLTLKVSGDIRSTLMSGSTFVMQVAHPQVGAGVGQLSNFRNDPWHRLQEINQSGERFMFSGREAGIAEGKRLRELHRNIKGVDADGNAFHSLNPAVYGWVHTIFLDTMVTQCRLYDTALDRQEELQLFEEWREMGRLFGLRDKDMPATLDQYWRHYNEMIADTLEYNDVIETILTFTPPAPTSLAWLPQLAWSSVWSPAGKLNYQLTLAALPHAFRAKIAAHHPWNEQDEKHARRFQSFVKSLVPRLPERMRYTAAGYRATRPVTA